jgi:hypothetical protein
MRFFDAYVQNRQLAFSTPTEIPEGMVVQLVSLDDAIDTIRALGENADRIALYLELEASIADVDAGRALDLDDALAKLRAKHVSMHSSIEQANSNIVIYQSANREGPTFSLSPGARKTLQGRFGDKLHISPRIFIANESYGTQAAHQALERLRGRLAGSLVALLTGLDDDLLAQVGDFEFRDPVTDEKV